MKHAHLYQGVRSNAMIYGNALGVPAQSVQIPALVNQAKASGVARYIGRGLNRWSNVHIADLAALYALAVAKVPGTGILKIGKALGVGTGTVQRVLMEQPRPFDVGVAEAAYASQ
jgi:nucleoside-diphosphate-sugar epimerase